MKFKQKGRFQMTIAFFDFDGTISKGDSFALFLRFILGRKFYVKLAQNLPILLLYKLGFISNSSVKERILASCIKGMEIDKFSAYCKDFLPNLQSICKDSALQKIAWHKAQGHKVAIVSASFEEYLGFLAQKLEIDLIATKMEVVDLRITGRFATPNCYGTQKVARIKARYNLANFTQIYAYGDTKGDKAMLGLASENCAFYRVFA